MRRENINDIYDGLVSNFLKNGAEVVSVFEQQRINKWEKISVNQGESVDLDFELSTGMIIRDKYRNIIGLALGKIEDGHFYNPTRLQFGAFLDGSTKLNGEVDDLHKLIKCHARDYASGEFYCDDIGGNIKARCWANDRAFGGEDLKSIDINSAQEIVCRTIKNGFKR